ncbi:unnamed protein product [Closterium sp. NIES-54]
MASTPALNRGNSSAPSSDTDRNAREMTGDRRNKRRAEEGSPAPTAVDVLLGGLEVNKNSSPPQQQHPSAPVALVAPEARVAQVATAAPAALVAPHAPDAEHTPAQVAGPSRQRQRRRTATSSDATTPALTNALTPDQVAALLSLLQQQPASRRALTLAPTVVETTAPWRSLQNVALQPRATSKAFVVRVSAAASQAMSPMPALGMGMGAKDPHRLCRVWAMVKRATRRDARCTLECLDRGQPSRACGGHGQP